MTDIAEPSCLEALFELGGIVFVICLLIYAVFWVISYLGRD